MEKLVEVRFIKSYPPYNGGEVAGFDEGFAKGLIASGAAVAHVEGPADGGADEEEEEPEIDETQTEEQYRAELGSKTKAQLVEMAKAEFALDLDEADKKDDLVEAIVDAAVEAAAKAGRAEAGGGK